MKVVEEFGGVTLRFGKEAIHMVRLKTAFHLVGGPRCVFVSGSLQVRYVGCITWKL